MILEFSPQFFFILTSVTSDTSWGQSMSLSDLYEVSNFSWICQLSYEVLFVEFEWKLKHPETDISHWALLDPSRILNWPKSPHRLGLTDSKFWKFPPFSTHWNRTALPRSQLDSARHHLNKKLSQPAKIVEIPFGWLTAVFRPTWLEQLRRSPVLWNNLKMSTQLKNKWTSFSPTFIAFTTSLSLRKYRVLYYQPDLLPGKNCQDLLWSLEDHLSDYWKLVGCNTAWQNLTKLSPDFQRVV